MGLEIFKIGEAQLNESIKNVRYMKRQGRVWGKIRAYSSHQWQITVCVEVTFTRVFLGGRGRSIWTPLVFLALFFRIFPKTFLAAVRH